MARAREVHTPDGRRWVVTRRPEPGGVARLLGRSRWVVEASTDGPPAETRHWYADHKGRAADLVEEVAMALRTGAEGPLQPDD